MDHKKIDALKRLLLNLFWVEDLRIFIHLRFGEEGLAVIQRVALSRSEDATVYAIVIALDQQGIVDARFFDHLVAERPRREPVLTVRPDN